MLLTEFPQRETQGEALEGGVTGALQWQEGGRSAPTSEGYQWAAAPRVGVLLPWHSCTSERDHIQESGLLASEKPLSADMDRRRLDQWVQAM